jgi:AcrR family transcriptional regulator
LSELTPQTPRTTRKPKGEGHVRRAEILAVAQEIFVKQGYEGATIRKIAQAIGLSSTALYMHFPDKAAILNEICKQTFKSLIDGSHDLQDDAAPPEVRLRSMIERYIAFGFENPSAYRLTYMTLPLDPVNGPASEVMETGIVLYNEFTRAVEAVIAAGRMQGDPVLLTQVIWATGHGIVSLQLAKPYFDWADREALVKVQLDALFKGLLTP